MRDAFNLTHLSGKRQARQEDVLAHTPATQRAPAAPSVPMRRSCRRGSEGDVHAAKKLLPTLLHRTASTGSFRRGSHFRARP